MNISKIGKFLSMNKYEKKRSIVRNTYSYIYRNRYKFIGKKSYFLNPIFISGMKYMKLGNDVGVWDGARVEIIDEWGEQKFTPELAIGNHVNIGQSLHLTCADKVVIEDNVLISARVSILGINHVTENKDIPILDQGIIAKPIIIKEGAFIGIDAVIMPGVTIGRHAIIGANSVVNKNVDDYVTVAGSPAKFITESFHGE